LQGAKSGCGNMKCKKFHPGIVIKAYQAPYPDPIVVKKDENVRVDRRQHTDIPGWLWCTAESGKSGWVPLKFLQLEGEDALLGRDYSAVELTVQPGDKLTLLEMESGFWWVTHADGRQGWVPEECIRIL
jgi:uncharacterized protein YgiM (DUF1202 family)